LFNSIDKNTNNNYDKPLNSTVMPNVNDAVGLQFDDSNFFNDQQYNSGYTNDNLNQYQQPTSFYTPIQNNVQQSKIKFQNNLKKIKHN
jgi:hypothetical protein